MLLLLLCFCWRNQRWKNTTKGGVVIKGGALMVVVVVVVVVVGGGIERLGKKGIIGGN